MVRGDRQIDRVRAREISALAKRRLVVIVLTVRRTNLNGVQEINALGKYRVIVRRAQRTDLVHDQEISVQEIGVQKIGVHGKHRLSVPCSPQKRSVVCIPEGNPRVDRLRIVVSPPLARPAPLQELSAIVDRQTTVHRVRQGNPYRGLKPCTCEARSGRNPLTVRPAPPASRVPPQVPAGALIHAAVKRNADDAGRVAGAVRRVHGVC